MLENLDDVIRRLSSFFVIPLVNVGLITLIVYFCSKGSVSVLVLIPEINVGGIASTY